MLDTVECLRMFLPFLALQEFGGTESAACAQTYDGKSGEEFGYAIANCSSPASFRIGDDPEFLIRGSRDESLVVCMPTAHTDSQ